MSKQRLTPLRIVLVHSPLVGTLCWSKLAPLLESRGHEVLVPDLTRSFEDGSPYCEQQIATIAQCARRGSVLVAHSGAGALVAGVDELVPELGGHVFVDAGLPTPGMSWMDTAPKELSSALISMAHDGWLPPWSEWFGEKAIVELLPESAMREAFIGDCHELPLAMFYEPRPTSPSWPNAPAAYLRLSDAYEREANQARAMDWPTSVLELDHLAILSSAALVVGPLIELIEALA
jgi:hypothetical protein